LKRNKCTKKNFKNQQIKKKLKKPKISKLKIDKRGCLFIYVMAINLVGYTMTPSVSCKNENFLIKKLGIQKK